MANTCSESSSSFPWWPPSRSASSPAPPTGQARERTYVVRPADTLWSIAARTYAGDPRQGVWELEQRNHLATDTLRPGQKLVLPG